MNKFKVWFQNRRTKWRKCPVAKVNETTKVSKTNVDFNNEIMPTPCQSNLMSSPLSLIQLQSSINSQLTSRNNLNENQTNALNHLSNDFNNDFFNYYMNRQNVENQQRDEKK